MKIAYAYRRSTFYPHVGDGSMALPGGGARRSFLKQVKEIGFDGVELGLDAVGGADASEGDLRRLREELEAAGTPCVALRAGGGLSQPNVAEENRRRLQRAGQVARWIGAGIVNAGLTTPPRNRTLGSIGVGVPVQPGSGQLATEEDFARTATALREVGDADGADGVTITIEVHQHSIADSSWSTLHLLELTDSSNVLANPDLGNIYWNYDVPEETAEEAITALAPRSGYWHCKNLRRVHVPELERAYFIRVPLPEGDIDYRFAISAMAAAGYDGYLAVEGARDGDQLHQDRQSVEYVTSVLRDLDRI